MPVRVVLNVAYALLVKGADAKQRRELDGKLYGLDEMQERANKELWDQIEGGGEG